MSSKTTDSVFSDHSFQHRLEQSSVSLNSSNLFGALHSCLTDQDSMLGKCTCKNSTVVNATITTQGLWPTSPTDPQTDKAVQALSAGRRTVSLSQQYCLLESSTHVESVQTQVRFVDNIFDFQNIDAEIPTENVVFRKRHFGRLFGLVVFTGITPKMSACLDVLGRSPSCTQNLYPKEDGCPNCRCIRRMAVRTLIGSAIQERLRSASSTRVPGNGMASRRSFSRSTTLLKSSSRGTGIVSFPGSSSVELLSSRISAAAPACDAICHHFNKNWQERVTVNGISNIQNSKRSKRPLAMASPVQHALYDS